jgi:hypothetical protein
LDSITVAELITRLQKCDPTAIVCECNNGGSLPYQYRSEGFKVRQRKSCGQLYVELGQFGSHTESESDERFDII